MDLKVMFFFSGHRIFYFWFFFFGLRVKSYYLFVLSVCLSVCVSVMTIPLTIPKTSTSAFYSILGS